MPSSSTHRLRNLYGRFFAATYDRMLAGAEQAGLRAERQRLLLGARGRTLEIGAGTGANLELYPSSIAELVLCEPEEAMAARLDRRCARLGRPATIERAAAESLPFAEDSFDTVVSTLVLCTVSDPQSSLAEVRRVLRPGGRLLLLEHVRSPQPKLARWQDRLNPLQKVIGHGCNCNRATVDLIDAAGFDVDRIEAGTLPKVPVWIRPMSKGCAPLR